MKRISIVVFGIALVLFPLASGAAYTRYTQGSVFFDDSPGTLLSGGVDITEWTYDTASGSLRIKGDWVRGAEPGLVGWVVGHTVEEKHLVITATADLKSYDLTGTFTGVYKSYNPDGSIYDNFPFTGKLTGTQQPNDSNNRVTWKGNFSITTNETGKQEVTTNSGFMIRAPADFNLGDGTGNVQKNSSNASISVYYVGAGVTYRKNGQGEDLPLTESTKLQPGDIVDALLDSATLKIGDQLLTVYKPTSFRLDASDLTPDRLPRTRVYLLDGVAKTKLPHYSAPRSDFHIETPGANASIRGSEMVVRYDKTTNVTTLYVTEDQATVQGKGDAAPVTVSQGSKVAIGADQKVGPTQPFQSSELPVDTTAQGALASTQGSWLLYGLGILGLIIVAAVYFVVRHRKS